MNIKSDDKLAIWVTRGVIVEILHRTAINEIVQAVCGRSFRVNPQEPAWTVKVLGSPQAGRQQVTTGYFFQRPGVVDSVLKPLRDSPGNESWFTAAPRSKPATTKQDTIDERGELA